MAEPMQASGERVPVPDPTALTTDLTRREIAGLREVVEAQIRGQREIHDTRLAGMDKAIELLSDQFTKTVEMLQVQIDQRPAEIDLQVGHLRVLMDEKFLNIKEALKAVAEGIQKQFEERDTRTDQTSRDSKLAIDAALQAAKEAVGKSETSTTKQIDQQGLLIQSGTKATDDKIDDIKARLQRIEGIAVGQVTATADTRAGSMDIRGIIALAISGAGIALAIVLAMTR